MKNITSFLVLCGLLFAFVQNEPTEVSYIVDVEE